MLPIETAQQAAQRGFQGKGNAVGRNDTHIVFPAFDPPILGRKHSDKEHRILASQLRTLLAKECPDFDPQQYGHTKFLPFIQSLGIFRVSSLGDDTTGGNKTFYFEVKGSHAD